MNLFSKYTPLRIAVPFILGIVCSLNPGIEMASGLAFLIGLICFLGLLFAYFLLRMNFRLRWISGLCASLSLFFLGAYMVLTIDQKGEQSFNCGGESVMGSFYLCKIDENPVEKSRTSTAKAITLAKMDSTGRWISFKSKILVCFKGDSLVSLPAYGDLILLSGDLQPIPGPPNPHMFSFRQYLNNSQVYHQVFLDAGRWISTGISDRNPIKSGAEICRNKFLEILRKFKIEGQDFALVSALLIGTKDYLDKEIIREFSYAGAIHVLSVSGLHVGIMYVVADRIFFFLKRGRKSRKMHAVLILAFIWAYAFITGLAASVMRAAMMFSLIAAGKMFKRSSDNFNILAVSAFFQLWINPFDITQVGFQLSYLAVLGIFAFYQPINDMVSPDKKMLSWIWSILAVSIAAQLATFPLASYYFSMFPVYFLATNLVVVPLAAVITYFAVTILAVGASGFTPEWMAWPLKWSLRFMQGSVETIQSWPGAVIKPVVLSPAQVMLIYIAIISIFAFGVLGYRKWAFVLLLSILMVSVISVADLYKKLDKSEIIVYQVPGNKAIDLMNNRKALFISDSALISDTGKIGFQIEPNRLREGIREIQVIQSEEHNHLSSSSLWIDWPFIYFRGKTVIIIDQHWKNFIPAEKISCDLAILSGNPEFNPENLKSQVDADQILIDSSVPFFKAKELLISFQDNDIPCHSVRHDGAYVMKW